MQGQRSRALVIGTSGQLARELHRTPRYESIDLLPGEKVDLTDQLAVRSLLDRMRPNVVINAAAYTAVDRAESEPDLAFAINANGPERLAAWCAQQGAALIHASTDYVFDGTKSSPYQTEDPTSPANVYGESKLAGELAVRKCLKSHVIVRTSWLFSAHGSNFVKTILRLAGERDQIRVVADQFGRPTPAADLAAALWCIARRIARDEEVPWGTYHFAGAGTTTWHGLAEAVIAEHRAFSGRAPAVVPIATSNIRPPQGAPPSQY